MYNETWRYRYYDFRQSLSIWGEAKIEIYYRSRKHKWLAKKLYNLNLFHSTHWFSKICDLINEIHGVQHLNYVSYGLSNPDNFIQYD